MPVERSQIIWSPAATDDLREIWRYFADVASRDIADRLLRDIFKASERARRRPLAWRNRDEIVPGLRSILVRPYTVFYRVSSNGIEIVRVLHQRRNFAAIFSDPES